MTPTQFYWASLGNLSVLRGIILGHFHILTHFLSLDGGKKTGGETIVSGYRGNSLCMIPRELGYKFLSWMPVFFFWKSSLLSHLSHKPSACQPLCLVCVVSWPLSVVICAVDSVFQSPRGILCIQGARGGRLLGRTVGVWWEGANWRPQSRRLMRRRQPPPSGVTQHSNAEEGGQKSPALHPHSKHERIGKVYPIFNLQVSVWFESSAAGCSFHTEENEVAHVVGGQLGGFKQPV